MLPAFFLIALTIPTHASDLAEIFVQRGYEIENIDLPEPGEAFPVERLDDPKITSIASFKGFPEGPSYRPSDGSFFFAGNVDLRRVDSEKNVTTILSGKGAGGTHFLPDGSLLIVGNAGLRRLMPDGTVHLLADAKELGGKNDITMGIHGEVYFSIPRVGIYRVTPGKDGKVEKVVGDGGGNGLDVDPSGKFLYVHRGGIRRYAINGVDQPLGEREEFYKFEQGKGGADGCTFDAWGNLYSMIFGRGVIAVFDTKTGELLREIDTGIAPSSNLTFGGKDNKTLYVTAGVPRLDNCQILEIDLGITGFPGHVGATEYPHIRIQDYKGNAENFGAK